MGILVDCELFPGELMVGHKYGGQERNIYEKDNRGQAERERERKKEDDEKEENE